MEGKHNKAASRYVQGWCGGDTIELYNMRMARDVDKDSSLRQERPSCTRVPPVELLHRHRGPSEAALEHLAVVAATHSLSVDDQLLIL